MSEGEAAGRLSAAVREGRPVTWLRSGVPEADAEPLTGREVAEAAARFERFRPALALLFPDGHWDGRIESPLIALPPSLAPDPERPTFAKGDHLLPMAGSVKARGGVHEVLAHVEAAALARGLIERDGDYARLALPETRAALASERVSVASTGNLGYAVGLAATAFGMRAEVHMSHDAKEWKKGRLRAGGVVVVEHPCDYSETSAIARDRALRDGAYFVDDETSRTLLVGYAVAAAELAAQLAGAGVVVDGDRPLVVYLPCGVGGAPGGIAAGLKLIYGAHVVPVFVEPTASACMLAALALADGRATSVYEHGMDNGTICDGLAVPRASETVLDTARSAIDAVVTVTDADALSWVRRAWSTAGLRLEPSAATALAAGGPFVRAARDELALGRAAHVAWLTGGSRLPDEEFAALLG